VPAHKSLPPDIVQDCVRSRAESERDLRVREYSMEHRISEIPRTSSFPVHTTVGRLACHWMERWRKYSHSPIHWGCTPAFRFCLGRLYSPGQTPISISWGLTVHGRHQYSTVRSRQVLTYKLAAIPCLTAPESLVAICTLIYIAGLVYIHDPRRVPRQACRRLQ
jgi:hypothetical protein